MPLCPNHNDETCRKVCGMSCGKNDDAPCLINKKEHDALLTTENVRKACAHCIEGNPICQIAGGEADCGACAKGLREEKYEFREVSLTWYIRMEYIAAIKTGSKVDLP